MLQVDNTRRNTARECKRKDYWSNVRGIKPTQGSTAIRYGVIWHAGMEGFYSHIMEHGWTRDGKAIEQAVTFTKEAWAEQNSQQTFVEDYRTLENCLRALILYMGHFNHDEGMLEVTSVEQVFKIKIEVDSPEKFPYVYKAGGFWFTGRLDVGVRLNGRQWLQEHKSTGKSLSQQKQLLRRDPQLIGYSFASEKIMEEPEGCLISLHQLIAYKSKTTGLYGEAKMDFDRVPEIYTEGDIEEWKTALIGTAEEILLEEERQIWPKDGDCYHYGQCAFTRLCEQNVPLGEEVLEGFIEREPWDVTKTVPESEVIVVD